MDVVDQATCMICSKTLCDSSHQNWKSIGWFKVKYSHLTLWKTRARFDQCRTLRLHGFSLVSAPLLTASFDVAHLAAEKLPHTVAESLIKPATVRVVDLVMGFSVVRVISQLVTEIKGTECRVALQPGESTNVANCYHFLWDIFTKWVRRCSSILQHFENNDANCWRLQRCGWVFHC